MVTQSPLEKLRDKPKDEKTVVAGGIAVSVVIVLLVGWGIYFLHSIESGAQSVNLSSGVQDQFNFSSTNAAQQQLQASLNTQTRDQQDIQDLRNSVDNPQAQTVQAQNTQQYVAGNADQFGNVSPQ